MSTPLTPIRRVEVWKCVGRRADLNGLAKVEAHGNKMEIAYCACVATKDGNTHDLDFKKLFVRSQRGVLRARDREFAVLRPTAAPCAPPTRLPSLSAGVLR